jgi:hypothetical protein
VTERAAFERALEALCRGVCNPAQHRGRPRKALANVIFAEVLTAFVGMSSRRAASDIRAAHEAGLIDEPISPKTLTSYLRNPALTDLLRAMIRATAEPFMRAEYFAVERLAFQTPGHERRFDNKRGRMLDRHVVFEFTFAAGTSMGIVGDTCGDGLALRECGWFDRPLTPADETMLDFTDLENDGCPDFLGGLWAMSEADLLRSYAVADESADFAQSFGHALLSRSSTAQLNEVLCRILAYNLLSILAPRDGQ